MKKIEYQSSSGRTADIVGYEAFVNGGNGDMNYFLEIEGLSDSARNYKVTYLLLNQNHSSYSDEQWWVPLDGRGQIQCCVTGHFTDGTWMRSGQWCNIGRRP